MDPLSSAITAGGSLLGGIVSSSLSNVAVKKQLAAQREENEKNRAFNADQAKLARDYNTEMVNQANEYNSPSNQVSRLMQAGLHPSLAYGGSISEMGTGSTSQQASFSGGVGTGLPDFSGIRDAFLNAANSMDISRGADLKRTLAQLNEKELAWYDKFANLRQQKEQQDIKVGNSVELLNVSNAKFTDTQNAEYGKIAASVEANTQLIYQKLETEKYETALKKIDAAFAPLEHSAALDKVISETNLNKKQIEVLGRQIVIAEARAYYENQRDAATVRHLDSLSAKNAYELEHIMPAQSFKVNAESKIVEIDASWRESSRLFQVLDQVTKLFGNILGIGGH